MKAQVETSGLFLYLRMSELEFDKNELRVLYVLIAFALFVNLFSLNSGFISDDSGLYALLSRNLLDSGNWYELEVYGEDWLDKPHFQFWVTALSIKFFGSTSFAYRLPALSFFLLGTYFTYRIGYLLKGRFIALLSVLLLLSTQHVIISNGDVRAETILIGLIVPSMYYLIKMVKSFSWKSLLSASLFSACAIMTKGLMVLIPAFLGVLCHYLLLRDFKGVFHFKWFGFVLITFLFLIPEFYALYLQFDAHPDKVVFGETGVSGVKWFLWDSQFGRFLGEGPISRPKSPFWEYWLNLVWAMAPWLFLFVLACIVLIKRQIKRKDLPQEIVILLCGTLGIMVVFSLSSFQLPHYTNIVYPFASVILAYFLVFNVGEKWVVFLNKFVLLILMGLSLALIKFSTWYIFVSAGILVVVLLIGWYSKVKTFKIIWYQVATLLILNFTVLVFAYPEWRRLKPEQEIADFVNDNYPRETVLLFDLEKVSHRFAYYLDHDVEMVNLESINLNDRYRLALVQDKWDDPLRWNGNKTQLIKSWDFEPSENLDLGFVFDGDQADKTRTWLLLRINP